MTSLKCPFSGSLILLLFPDTFYDLGGSWLLTVDYLYELQVKKIQEINFWENAAQWRKLGDLLIRMHEVYCKMHWSQHWMHSLRKLWKWNLICTKKSSCSSTMSSCYKCLIKLKKNWNWIPCIRFGQPIFPVFVILTQSL